MATVGVSGQSTDYENPSPRPPPLRAAFFPPTTPTYGAPIAELRSMRRGLRPPEGLADFVNESFYPALAARRFDATLHPALQDRLDAYLSKRTALVNTITDAISLLESADAATRDRELAALSARQQAPLAALEAEAEQLRETLIRGGLLQPSADWNADRKWKLGVTTFSPVLAPVAEFDVVRAAAYFQSGLTIAQRGLLRELALELRAAAVKIAAARAAPSEPVTVDFDLAAVFFSPETTRFILPPGLPQALTAKIAAYCGEKAALTRELRATVNEQDQAWAAVRKAAFESLADRQAPRLVALDNLAEEIRRDLAALPPPPPLAAPPLPPELLDRIASYERDRTMIASELDERIRLAITPPIQAPASFTEEERRYWYERLEIARNETRQRVTREFQSENRERYDELIRRYHGIYAELAAIAQTKTDPRTGRPLTAEQLQHIQNAATQQFDQLGREEIIYKNYRNAMLLPGLSPAQRRLLFGVALVGLAQPLPQGTPMPSERLAGLSL